MAGGRGGAKVELPEGRQEDRELLNNLYLLTSLNGTWSMYGCVASSIIIKILGLGELSINFWIANLYYITSALGHINNNY